MYQLHYWPTPNGHKITLFLEEAGLPYEIVPVDIRSGAQFDPAFLAIAPNNRMPALVDTDSGISLFESGAILWWLAERHGRFIEPGEQGRAQTLQWLFWQMAGLGPMMGQASHFLNYAPEKLPYAITRYTNESLRLLKVMDRRLADRAYLAGDGYSVADMAAYPWAILVKRLRKEAAEGTVPPMPHLDCWIAAIAAREATVRAYAIASEDRFQTGEITEEQKVRLFHQSADSVR